MLFVPIWDLNPLRRVRFQYVTIGIIVINILIYFVFESGHIFHMAGRFIASYALHPANEAPLSSVLQHLPAQFQLLTYMFLHGSAWHLFANMIFLFVFGDNVEDALGHVRFGIFYLLCGALAALCHSQITSTPEIPLIGASGAISGVIGAYLMLHPNVRVWVLMPSLPILPLRFSAAFVIGIWIVYQIVSALYLPTGSTAWWAHIGGFAAGALFITVMKRPGVKLFGTPKGA